MEISTIIEEIKIRKVAVAKERDKLDSLIEELTDLKESCNKAWDALQEALDALSELV